MRFDIGKVLQQLYRVNGALSFEPDIWPDLSSLTQAKLPVVLLSLMDAGVETVDGLSRYIEDHDAPFDRIDVAWTIADYSASPGGKHGLWRERDDGSLEPLVRVGR